jgi:protein phosphatase
MGTTLTAVFTAGDDLFYAHVGHSRLYLFRDGELLLLTRDQTLAQRLVDRPLAGPVEMAGQDIGHILTDVIGGRGRTQVDIEHLRLLDGDTLLLCTDGLTNVVDDERIAALIAGPRRLQEQCEALVALAGRVGTDDITVLMATFRIPRGPHAWS